MSKFESEIAQWITVAKGGEGSGRYPKGSGGGDSREATVAKLKEIHEKATALVSGGRRSRLDALGREIQQGSGVTNRTYRQNEYIAQSAKRAIDILEANPHLTVAEAMAKAYIRGNTTRLGLGRISDDGEEWRSAQNGVGDSRVLNICRLFDLPNPADNDNLMEAQRNFRDVRPLGNTKLAIVPNPENANVRFSTMGHPYEATLDTYTRDTVKAEQALTNYAHEVASSNPDEAERAMTAAGLNHLATLAITRMFQEGTPRVAEEATLYGQKLPDIVYYPDPALAEVAQEAYGKAALATLNLNGTDPSKPFTHPYNGQ